MAQKKNQEERESGIENSEQFIKEMMEQRKLQQEALNKIMSSIDTPDEHSVRPQPETEEKNILKRIFKNRK